MTATLRPLWMSPLWRRRAPEPRHAISTIVVDVEVRRGLMFESATVIAVVIADIVLVV